MRVFLTCYSFQIHPKNKPDEFLKFNDLPATNHLLRDALANCLNGLLGNTIVSDKDGSCSGVEEFHQDGEIMYGKFSTGDYGHRSRFRNVITNVDTFTRSPDDAEQIGYHFLFWLNDEQDKGILITQKLGIRGVHTALRKIIHQYLSNTYGVIFRVSELVPNEVYNYLRRGDTTRVTFNHVQLPHDKVTALGWEGVNYEQVADVQLVIRAKRGFSLPQLSARLQGQYTTIIERRLEQPNDNREVDNIDIDIEDVDIEVTYGGNARTVSFEKPSSFTPMVDISREVRMNDGTPNFDDILAQSRILLDDVRTQIRGY